ncbi:MULTISPECIES: SDR family oxidoreductase [Pseudomonas]|uniref:SDR family oxidoreductase n=1 Tax=Pseudomonas TaxID=286 RepID=UPI000B34C4BA|nr:MULTISPECIES: SDR family oxidoreductase [Pseudomonas]PMY64050.1 short chain dehydrogenase [Pseudomonas sp. FW305-25]PMY68001.1 short chain dehydrogenase [Pseudomonas sp. FW126-L8]PNA79349.1 short chain dehydrogenase [Pseudomonas sp. FW305-76]
MLTSPHPLPNVILWAVSRSRSTAFERAVMQHPDVRVLHERLSEPFLARHFPDKHVLIEHTRQTDHGLPGITGYTEAMGLLCEHPAPPQRLQFSKEIAYFFDFQAINGAWLTGFKHVFLVRRPLDVMQSLYRVSQSGGTTYFDADESGFDELARIHDLVLGHCDSSQVLYLDSDADLMSDPQGTLMRFCDFAGIDFSPRLLSWAPEKVEQWQFFKGWHDDAERSSGFAQVAHPAMMFPEAVERTARNKQSIYKLFQLAATWQRLTSTPDHLYCLYEPAAARLQVLLIVSTKKQQIRALQWAAHLLDDYAVWLWDKPEPSHFDAITREVELLQALPLVALVPDEDPISLGFVQHLGSRLLCLIGPDSLQARQTQVPLVAVDRFNPNLDEVNSLIAQSVHAATQLSRELQIATNRLNCQTNYPQLSWNEHLSALLQDAPDSIVAITPQQSLSARDLNDHACRLAERLAQTCPKAGWVAIRLDRDLRTLVTMTACSLLGWPYLDIADWYGVDGTTKALANLEPVVVVGDARTLQALPGSYRTLLLDNLPALTGEAPIVRAQPFGTLAYGLLTSGTTGPAKVVTIDESGRLDSLAFWQKYIRPGDRIGLNAWMTGYVYYPIFSGAVACLIPDTMVLAPQALRNFVREGRLTQLMITPSLVAGLLQDKRAFQQAFAGVHTLWLSGEQLPPATRMELIRYLPQCLVLDLYGSNEAGDVALSSPDGRLHFTPDTQAYVLDSTLECVPLGGQGELYVNSPGLSPGYLKDDAANRKAFVTNPLAIVQPDLARRLLRTGDVVRLTEAGGIDLMGRATTHLKLRGFKIFSADVERVLMSHPEVQNALVTTRGDGPDIQLIAFVTPTNVGHPPPGSTLRQWAGQYLPAFSVPLAFFLAPSIPAGASQKRLNAQALLQQALAPLPDNEQPLTPLQIQVAELWADCMNLQGVTLGPDSDFIDIGGSLLLLDLMNRINRTFQSDLSIVDITRNATLAGITEQLTHRLQGAPIREANFSISAEAERYLTRLSATAPPVAPRKARRTILVTGATGYLGRMIVRELQQTQGVERILCLVRANDSAHAQRRVAELGRVEGLAGDLGQAQLGLADEDYQRLHADVDCIIHCAADVNWLKRYASLAEINVGGLLQMLDLAALGGAALVFASTLPEAVPTTGYNRAKLVAEQVAMAFCKNQGIRLSILRCGDISAPARAYASSPINPDDYVGLMIRSCLTLKAWPEERSWSLNLTPVDYVAQVFVHTALGNPVMDSSPIQHLYNPAPNTQWVQLCAWMQTLVGQAQFAALPLAEWQARLRSLSPGNTVLQRTLLILPMIIDDFIHFNHPAPLQLDHLSCPVIDAEWTQQYLTALNLYTGETP